jgi:hypothetical protein
MLPDSIYYMATHHDHTANQKLIVGGTNGHLY